MREVSDRNTLVEKMHTPEKIVPIVSLGGVRSQDRQQEEARVSHTPPSAASKQTSSRAPRLPKRPRAASTKNKRRRLAGAEVERCCPRPRPRTREQRASR